MTLPKNMLNTYKVLYFYIVPNAPRATVQHHLYSWYLVTNRPKILWHGLAAVAIRDRRRQLFEDMNI